MGTAGQLDRNTVNRGPPHSRRETALKIPSPSLSLRPQQAEFLDGFVARDDPRTLLVAKPGTGKTVMAQIVATQMLATELVDRVLLVAERHATVEYWRETIPADENIRADITGAIRTATYSAIQSDFKAQLQDTPPAARWLLIFEEVDWRAEHVELFAAHVLATYPGSRALFIATEVPPIDVDARFEFSHEHFDPDSLARSSAQTRLSALAPSLSVLQKIQKKLILLDDLSWREFEQLIARMLETEGYIVELMQGTKDNGVDVVAMKDLPGVGLFKSVWQAKKYRIDRKVGLSLVRELADTRAEHGASKAMIVTTSFLTSGALARVERDRYVLGKMDRSDLDHWVMRTLRGGD